MAAGKSLKTCPNCGNVWETLTTDTAPRCPYCNKVNAASDEKTPVPGALKAVRPPAPAAPMARKPAAPPPAVPAPVAAASRPAISQKPISTKKPSHLFRNLIAIVIGLAGAAVGLHLAGLLRLPNVVWQPVEKMAKKVKDVAAPAEKPKETPKPKEEVKKPEPPPEVKPPEPKAPPMEPDPDFSKEIAYEVLKVEDGATIVVKGPTKNISVHLLGVTVGKPGDAPVHGVRDGTETREWVKSQLKGQKIYLYYGTLDTPKWRAERDAFGSDRAWVFRASDKMFLNLELVKEGYARSDTKAAKEFEELLMYWEERAPK
jgi:endonuclease YncB( thermonuclease family)